MRLSDVLLFHVNYIYGQEQKSGRKRQTDHDSPKGEVGAVKD